MADINCKICWGSRWEDDDCTIPCPECVQELPKPKRRKPQPRLRQKSEKKKAIEAEMGPLRKRWMQKVKTCQNCNQRMATDVHEIVAGSGRHLSFEDPETWLALCGGPDGCHRKVQSIPYEQQLEIKFRAIRRAVNRCATRKAV